MKGCFPKLKKKESSDECTCSCKCEGCKCRSKKSQLEGPAKRALLIGINYFGSKSELRGCHEDVSNMKKYLKSIGFKDIVVMTDDRAGNKSSLSPKKDNIIRELTSLASRCKSGDLVVVHYSGHGSQLPCVTGEEKDGQDETWCPVDLNYSKKDYGYIRDNQIHDILVGGTPEGVKLRIFSDSCHSGSIGDLPLIWSLGNICMTDVKLAPGAPKRDIIAISGCRDDQTSADAYISGSSQGAMSWSLLSALREAKVVGSFLDANHVFTWPDLVGSMRKSLADGKYKQVPQLSMYSRDQLKNPVDLF